LVADGGLDRWGNAIRVVGKEFEEGFGEGRRCMLVSIDSSIELPAASLRGGVAESVPVVVAGARWAAILVCMGFIGGASPRLAWTDLLRLGAHGFNVLGARRSSVLDAYTGQWTCAHGPFLAGVAIALEGLAC